ncbi:MAG: GvpL/GvpF family gas vesicle protein [Streptosporangiaceae bacterium]|nr:GvpL/GvpF family gas vesicle protein [Streptosporangiaceae bacterium]
MDRLWNEGRERQEWEVTAYAAESSGAADATASAQSVHAELSTYAVSSRLHREQCPRFRDDDAVMVFAAAYLLDEAHVPHFAAAVTVLGARHPALRLVLSGPWPAPAAP